MGRHRGPRVSGPFGRQVRILLRADFLMHEDVIPGAEFGGATTLEGYLHSGTIGRLGSRLWALIGGLVSLFVASMTVVALASAPPSVLQTVMFGGFGLLVLYLGLRLLAGWRCMHRHRRAERPSATEPEPDSPVTDGE